MSCLLGSASCPLLNVVPTNRAKFLLSLYCHLRGLISGGYYKYLQHPSLNLLVPIHAILKIRME
jgi:hypothetical protein